MTFTFLYNSSCSNYFIIILLFCQIQLRCRRGSILIQLRCRRGCHLSSSYHFYKVHPIFCLKQKISENTSSNGLFFYMESFIYILGWFQFIFLTFPALPTRIGAKGLDQFMYILIFKLSLKFGEISRLCLLFFISDLTTLGTLLNFDWLVYYVECPNVFNYLL